MSGGNHEFTRTQIAPVFDALQARRNDWVRTLLELNRRPGGSVPALEGLDLKFHKGFWGKTERSFDPPVALLSWLIRNPTPQLLTPPVVPERRLLADGEPAVVARALHALRSSAAPKGWHLLEGPTAPAVMIETADALVVIESNGAGPNGEGGAGTPFGRPQLWRHIDAAWEIRGRRRVFGFFIVPGQEPDGTVPPGAESAFGEALGDAVLAASFPHRSAAERDAITSCFLGGTTWHRVCETFSISSSALPRKIHEPG